MATVGLAVILRGIVVLIWGSEPLNFPAGLPTAVVSIAGVPF
jgi:branched-chain amino acid transport system permease protein